MNRIVQLLKTSEVFFFLSGITTNVLNYAFHVLTAFFLLRTEYADLSVFLSFLMFVTVPVVGVQTALTKHFAAIDSVFPSFFAFASYVFVRFVVLGGLTLLCFYWGFLLLIETYLLHSFDLFLIYCTWLGFLILALQRGAFQYSQAFFSLGIHMLVESLCKLLFFVVFVFLGITLFLQGSLLTAFLSTILVGVGTFLVWKPKIGSVVDNSLKKSVVNAFWWDVFTMSCSQVVLIGFISLDLLLMDYFFPAFTSDYSVAAKIGQLLFMVLFLLIQIDFSHESNQDKDQMSLITNTHKWMLALVIVLCAFFCFGFFPEFFVTLLFGSKYIAAAPYLLLYGVGMLGLAGAQYLIHVMLLAKRYHFVPIGFFCLFVLLVGAAFFATSPWSLLLFFVSLMWCFFCLLGIDFFFLYTARELGRSVKLKDL